MGNRYGERAENERKEFIENVRTGYEVASNLWVISDQNYWAIFNALLVANTILLAGIGWLFSKDHSDNDIFLNYLSSIILPIAGLLVCIIWFFISCRRSVYCQYNAFSARKLEEYLAPLTTMVDADKLSRGKEVTFYFESGKKKTVKIKFLPKINVAWFSYIVIGLFALT